MNPGKVYLIGAGPGDPELLTLKAVRMLGEADVVLVDDLVNPEVLAHCRADARIVRVGKRGGCRSTPQAFIEKLMVRYARQGRCVARVKGGDPLVFGRGGEELAALRAAGIEARVASGITAGIGAAGALGMALTHRDCAPGVTLVTGHPREDGGAARTPDWRALAASGTTLVIYMGLRTLPATVAALQAGGMDPATPCCAVQSATLGAQRAVRAPLVRLAAAVAEAELASPAVVVVGEVTQQIQEHILSGNDAGQDTPLGQVA